MVGEVQKILGENYSQSGKKMHDVNPQIVLQPSINAS